MKNKHYGKVLLAAGLICAHTSALLAGPGGPITQKESAQEMDAGAINAALGDGGNGQGVAVRKSGRLLVMKEFLGELPPAERAEVLNSMVLVNGAVASFNYGPIKKRLTPGAYLDKIHGLEGPPADAHRAYPGEKSRFAELSRLLKDVPVNARNEFLDNMVFVSGQLVSVNIGALRKHAGSEKLIKILDLLAYDSHARPVSKDGKALCGKGWCTHAGCAAIMDDKTAKPGEYHAVKAEGADSVCYSSCGGY